MKKKGLVQIDGENGEDKRGFKTHVPASKSAWTDIHLDHNRRLDEISEAGTCAPGTGTEFYRGANSLYAHIFVHTTKRLRTFAYSI